MTRGCKPIDFLPEDSNGDDDNERLYSQSCSTDLCNFGLTTVANLSTDDYIDRENSTDLEAVSEASNSTDFEDTPGASNSTDFEDISNVISYANLANSNDTGTPAHIIIFDVLYYLVTFTILCCRLTVLLL